MPKNSGSVAATISQAQRRSNRVNRGCNGRDIQLDRLGEQLTAPTRATKKRFAPDKGMQLEVNARAPLPKKRRTKVNFLTQIPFPEVNQGILGSCYPAILPCRPPIATTSTALNHC